MSIVQTRLSSSWQPVYVFNKDSLTICISGTDKIKNPVLAYGYFNVDSLKDYINCCAFTVNYLELTNQILTNNSFASIEPMIKTHWHQYSPYNNCCPLIDNVHSKAGCVSIALAQWLYYNGIYSTKKEIPSYYWNDSLIEKTNIINKFDSISQFVYTIGKSVKMNWGVKESMADFNENMLDSVIGYFGLEDKNLTYINRSNFFYDNWEKIVYANLPVLYGGISYRGGHLFIIDGYSNGLFHVNWGWGKEDGWFMLNLMDPDDDMDGYANEQYAVVSDNGYTIDTLSNNPSDIYIKNATMVNDSIYQVVYINIGNKEYYGTVNLECYDDSLNIVWSLYLTSLNVKAKGTEIKKYYIKRNDRIKDIKECTWKNGEKYYFIHDSEITDVKKNKKEHSSYWFDLSGRKLSKKPSIRGIYIKNGNKCIIH